MTKKVQVSADQIKKFEDAVEKASTLLAAANAVLRNMDADGALAADSLALVNLRLEAANAAAPGTAASLSAAAAAMVGLQTTVAAAMPNPAPAPEGEPAPAAAG